MNFSSVGFFLDIFVAGLLVATIVYGSILNRKLSALRSNKAELDVLIQSFNDACMRAESGVRSLRTATDEAQRLQQYLSRGQVLRDDISYLIDRGTGLADRLEGNVRSARSETQSGSLSAALGSGAASGSNMSTPMAGNLKRGFSRSADADVMAELKSSVQPSSPKTAANAQAAPSSRSLKSSMADNVPDQATVADDQNDDANDTNGRPTPIRTNRDRATLKGENRSAGDAAPRSRAEKELLDALRAKR